MKYILFFLLIFSSCFVSAENPVAITSVAEGAVELLREEDKQLIETGFLLINQDEIHTGGESFCAVKFVDGANIIRVFPNSIFTVSAEEEDAELNKSVFVRIGSLFAQVLQDTGIFSVETPSAVATVKGTRFLLIVDDEGNTEIFVVEGEVEVENKEDGNTVLLGAGDYCYTSGSGPIETQGFDNDDLPDDVRGFIDDDPEEIDLFEIEIRDTSGDLKKIRIHLTD